MTISRSAQIALLVLLTVKVAVLYAMIYQNTVTRDPFWRAERDFEVAFARGDLEGQERAIKAECAAQASGLFPSIPAACGVSGGGG